MIQRIVSNLFGNPIKYSLGRWGILCDHAKTIITDRANVDHCGPCGTDNVINVEERLKEIDKNINLYNARKLRKEEVY